MIKGQKSPEKQNHKPPFKQEQKCKYYGCSHLPRQYPAYGKMCGGYHILNHFQATCKTSGGRRATLHDIEPEQNTMADKVIQYINSFNFNNIHSIIVAKLKHFSCIQNNTTIPHKIDTGSDGNIIPYHIFKSLFLRASTAQLVGMKMGALS